MLSDGKRDASYTGPITVEVAEGPGYREGTLTVDAEDGVARFGDLVLGEPATTP